MSNYSDDIKEKLFKSFSKKVSTSTKLKGLLDDIKPSSAYANAYGYADEIAVLFDEALAECGVETWYYGTAKESWQKSLEYMNTDINEVCRIIQANKNAEAGISIKPQLAKLNPYDVDSLIYDLTVGGSDTTLQRLLDEFTGRTFSSYDKIRKFCLKNVDNTQRANIDFQTNSGIDVQIYRKYDGVGLHRNDGHKQAIGCNYCISRQGSYEDLGKKIYERHDGCGCTIDYYSSKLKGTKHGWVNAN